MRGLMLTSPAAPALLVASLLVAACDVPEWLAFDSEPSPLPGERVSILSLQGELAPDPLIQDVAIRLPPPRANAAWPQAGGAPGHAMQHLELSDRPQLAWRRKVGTGSEGYRRLLASPVAAGGRVFTLDARADVAAVDAATGRLLWQVPLQPPDEEYGAIGGGLAHEGDVLYATTGFGEVAALDAESGRVLWRRNLGAPVRAPPTVGGGRVFAITVQNRTYALARDDGRPLWQHEGLPEDAGLMGAASAAVAGGIVVAPYSSGEVHALRADNGRAVWSDLLTRTGAAALHATFSSIAGAPVVVGDQVYAIGNAGRMAAMNLRTGARAWDRAIGGAQMPWVAGDFIYLVTSEADLVCLSRGDGRIRWVSPLQRYEDPGSREGPIRWNGPLLAGDRLVLVSSDGRALTVSPYTGELLGTVPLPGGVHTRPIVADRSLYVLTDDAELLAIR